MADYWRCIAYSLSVFILLASCNSSTLNVPDYDSGVPVDECDECPAGTVCRDGACRAPDSLCTGVVCGAGTVCYLGVCVATDACADVVCSNPGEACRDGACVSGEDDGDGDGFVLRDDCEDGDPLINPDAIERCNGLDDDCDDLLDEDFDGDRDGFPGCGGTLAAIYDCADDEPGVNPIAEEVCDGQDNDCDGDVDQGASPSPICPICFGTDVRSIGTSNPPGSCSAAIYCDACLYYSGDGEQYFCRSNDGGPYRYILADHCTEARRCESSECGGRLFFCDPEIAGWVEDFEMPVDDCDGLDNDCDGVVDSTAGTSSCELCADEMTRAIGVTTQPTSCDSSTECYACLSYEGDLYYCRSNDGGPYRYILPDHCTESRRCELTECAGQRARCLPETGWVVEDELPEETCDGIDNDCDGVVDSSGGVTICPECLLGPVAQGMSSPPGGCSASVSCEQCVLYDGEEYYCRSTNGGPYEYVLPMHCTADRLYEYTECDGQCFTCDGAGTWAPGCS